MRPIAASVVLYLCITPLAGLGQTCERLSGATSVDSIADSVDYLRAERQLPLPKQNSACITIAIRQLEHHPSADAIEVLIQFLDFKRPTTDMDSYRPSNDPARFYPASSTLITLGEDSVGPLIGAIKNSKSPITDNAIYTLMGIRRETAPSVVRLLAEEAAKSSGTEAQNLRGAAQSAAQLCGRRFRQMCMDQLK
jgi:hypothetical protein